MKTGRRRVGIIGKTPPPYGGVTVHIDRLIDLVSTDFPEYEIVLINNWLKLYQIPILDVVHVHQNNPRIRFLIVILLKIFRLKIICTYHRDHNREYGFNQSLTRLTSKLVSRWVTLNEGSYNYFKALGKVNVIRSSSFIPPSKSQINSITPHIRNLQNLKINYELIICTCAHHYREYKGKDIYGIEEVLTLAKSFTEYLWILADPSGEYSKLLPDKVIYRKNIYIISEQHDFIPIINLSDVYVRNTNTDGDSVSVKEALFLGKNCLATNIIDRPKGCITYNIGDLHSQINKLKKVVDPTNVETLNPIDLYEF